MPFKLRKSDKKIIQLLLDIYAEKTTLPIAYYDLRAKRFTWSHKGHYSPLCDELNNKCSKSDVFCRECAVDHELRCFNPAGKLEMCHAGLWNVALPINIGDTTVGTLLSGQRRVNDKKMSNMSSRAFQSFVKKQENHEKKEILIRLFDSTPAIDELEFDSQLLETLKKIQEYVYNWLYEQQRDIRDFRERVHTLAHEFLIPIQSIIADSENLFIEVESGELKLIAENILKEMQKLAIIAENMRSSVIGAKREQYIFEKHSIYKLLMKGRDLYQSEASQKGVEIRNPTTTDSTGFPYIEVESTQLQIAINNVLQNAVKYSFSSATGVLYIEIKCKTKSDNFYEISVSNLGTGILQYEIDDGLIFQSGYRGRLSLDKHRTGSGIGLSEVKRIIDLHGGSIHISSTKTISEAFKTIVNISIPAKRPESRGE